MEIKYCACGCNKIVKFGNTYINGHNKPTLGKPSKFRGKSYVERFGNEKANEISEKIRVGKVGDTNPAKRPEVKKLISENRRGKLTKENNPNYWKNKKNPGQSKRMKLNNPAHIPSVSERKRVRQLNFFYERGCVKIGKNETRILDVIEKYFGFTILRQYRIGGYAVDGYLPNLNIAIEIDENHHYGIDGKLRTKDIKRQKIIEDKLKCRMIRINDNIKNNEELFEKLKKLI
jgi:very-short-patch-repair endonuclease